MKKFLFVFFISVVGFAQNPERKYLSHTFYGNRLEVAVSDGTYFIHFLNDLICETSFVPKGEKRNTDSHSVVLNSKIGCKQVIHKDNLHINSKNISVRIDFSPFQISYYSKGKLITSEKAGYFKKKHVPMDLTKDNIKADSTEVLQFNLNPDEVLYGGGARVLGMNRRGNKLPLYNRAHYGYETKSELMNFTLPIVISSQKYMIHFDNAPVGYLDLDSQKNNTLEYETISGRKTYQIIVADSWEDLMANYTKLTGRQPMPPRWALGNFASRFGYHSEAEARNTIAKFKEEKIPVDAIILDLYWFGKDIQGTMGNLEVFRDSFPNFEKMVADFNAMGVKTIPITEPFVLTTSSKWNEAVDKKVLTTKSDGTPATWDFYFGNTGLVDVFKPEGKNWFWSIYKDLANKGVAGVWGDLGEPEVFPSFANTIAGSADEVHNLYGNHWAKMIFEGYQKDFPNQRPFILMRAGSAGSQRYGMIPWSGDVNRTWGGFSGQTEIALQMGMQGLGYMHSDLGGFAGANLDDELYVRWLQYGVFNPIFRPHAQEEVPSEPVFRSEKAKNLAKKAIELRYMLLPYNYNLAFQNHKKGTPLMRPLFFEEDKNVDLLNHSDSYLWGEDILVYPIKEKGKQAVEVYFPKTANWYDPYTSWKYEAGSTKSVQVSEDRIPYFVRGGSFIPMAYVYGNTSTYDQNSLTVHYYHDASVKESEREFYFDDGTTPDAYEKKNFEMIELESKFDGKTLELEIESEVADNYKGKDRTIFLLIHNIDAKPKSVTVSKGEIKDSMAYTSKVLEIKCKIQPNQESKIKIKL
ncbi:TIM-barrel domain-containing protein [Flavobacterium sp. GCM10023249]|uniref:TIM-barrel domain-containing protein n=1 Tax=unclassified Flavobacterium TaxID=196869 RepID=UPI0036175B68